MWLMLIIAEADELVGSYRREHDAYARFSVPAHVTVRKPFLPPTRWNDDDVHQALSRLIPVEVTLARVEDRPGALVIVIDPDAQLRRLTAKISAAWPELPPHKDNRSDLAYHITVARTADPAIRTEIADEIRGHLPLRVQGDELWAGTTTENGYTNAVLVRASLVTTRGRYRKVRRRLSRLTTGEIAPANRPPC